MEQPLGINTQQFPAYFFVLWMPTGFQTIETAQQPDFSLSSPQINCYFQSLGSHTTPQQLHQPEEKPQEADKPSELPSLGELTYFNRTYSRFFWSEAEDLQLMRLQRIYQDDWVKIASEFPNRSASMCYSRYRRLVIGKKRHWRKDEDELIIRVVGNFGFKWKYISKHLQNRSPKQVREHYLNFLKPGIDKSPWTPEEDKKICELVTKFGKRWKSFEKHLPGRYENLIKARYYGHLRGILQIKNDS